MSQPTVPTSFVLASRSPRRIELLREAGFADFTIDPADIDEDDVPAGLSPNGVAEHLAIAKARAVAAQHPRSIVLGSDTVVAVGERLFGKAETPDEARAMLRELGGTRQAVITAVALVVPGRGKPIVESATSIVAMRAMSPIELEAYVASDAWRGKAGAYGIQDHDPANDPFVRIESGDFSNVVGLPLDLTKNLLRGAGILPNP